MITICKDSYAEKEKPLVSIEVLGKDKYTTIYAFTSNLKSLEGNVMSESDFEYYLSFVDQMVSEELHIIEKKISNGGLEAAEHLRGISIRASHIFTQKTGQYFQTEDYDSTSEGSSEESLERTMIIESFSYRVKHIL